MAQRRNEPYPPTKAQRIQKSIFRDKRRRLKKKRNTENKIKMWKREKKTAKIWT